jgi:hypothetical protein
MGNIDNVVKDIQDKGNKPSVDNKNTTTTEKPDGTVEVRNSTAIVDHTEGTHDTVWNKTSTNVNTGESKIQEGAHGPNFDKKK